MSLLCKFCRENERDEENKPCGKSSPGSSHKVSTVVHKAAGRGK
jgi:hypothetical protein